MRIEYGLVVVLLAQTLVVVVVCTQEFLVVSCSRGCGENSGRGGAVTSHHNYPTNLINTMVSRGNGLPQKCTLLPSHPRASASPQAFQLENPDQLLARSMKQSLNFQLDIFGLW